MGKPSIRKLARFGTPIRTSVIPEVAEALLHEAGRCKRTVEHVVSEILRYWYEDVYLPNEQAKKKPPG